MDEKDVDWRGTSLDDIKKFPTEVKKDLGFELHKIQNGHNPTHFKAVNRWGAGVIEIKIKGDDGEYRVVYVAKFAEAVYVLHAFQKKTQQTSPKDVSTIVERYKAVVEERSKLI
ncbi:type II toxin-antitoxin system RelE/ParE family toxin [Type-D symbiont of Plautia stali]|uniref:type II toxin-antitoxin system RelE/ParE family toxin n=1 Tax=Type-D symbiont of Plautia stali TaxID=1560356 RepID=UPI00073F8573|nr:type II toxin-antitoxin system RelE/ParE family toxin [Type-D symbiont of Plautia stali]